MKDRNMAQAGCGMAGIGRLGRMAVLALALAAVAPVAGQAAEGPFSAVVYVNDQAITRYELDQRIKFMTILRQPGDIEKLAMDTLIEDRLRTAEAERLGISISAEQVQAGMTEFASRANLTADEFIKAVGQGGVDAETFRDFVSAGMIWREVVRARYAPTTFVTDAEIDRAMGDFKPEVVPTLKVAEIILPGEGKARSGSLALARRLKAQITDAASFEAAARAHSQGDTAGSGGVRDWQRLTEFDDTTRAALQRTAPGTVTPLVVTEKTVALYIVLDKAEEQLSPAEMATQVEYAEFLLPDDAGFDAAAAKMRDKARSCDDLNAFAKGLPEDRLTIKTTPESSLPGDVKAALMLMDPGESATAIRRGGWRVYLMLCRRGMDTTFMPTREDARSQLMNQRLSQQAEVYLEELRAEAVIREP